MALLPDAPEAADRSLTDSQRQMLAMMDGAAGPVGRRPEPPSPLFWEVALGIIGIAALLMGVVMVFFFAALGSLLLVAGGIVCAVAFKDAARQEARRDAAAEET